MADKLAKVKVFLAATGLIGGAGIFLVLLARGPGTGKPPSASAPSVLLVTIDGVRREDAFGDTREDLMPFLWREAILQGQAIPLQVTNGANVSYPGYNELLVGRPDPALKGNERIPNPNVSVLAWLAGHRSFSGRVAAFASWYMMDYVIPRERHGLVVNAGFARVNPVAPGERAKALDARMEGEPTRWPGVRPDAMTTAAALLYLDKRKPRVLYVSLGEADELGHLNDLPGYLEAVRSSDGHIATLWRAMQAMPEYAGHTTLIVTTDHGRGHTPATWSQHGPDLPEAADAWLFAAGPLVVPAGLRAPTERLALAQVAATVAATVGKDYAGDVKDVAPVIPGLLKSLE